MALHTTLSTSRSAARAGSATGLLNLPAELILLIFDHLAWSSSPFYDYHSYAHDEFATLSLCKALRPLAAPYVWPIFSPRFRFRGRGGWAPTRDPRAACAHVKVLDLIQCTVVPANADRSAADSPVRRYLNLCDNVETVFNLGKVRRLDAVISLPTYSEHKTMPVLPPCVSSLEVLVVSATGGRPTLGSGPSSARLPTGPRLRMLFLDSVRLDCSYILKLLSRKVTPALEYLGLDQVSTRCDGGLHGRSEDEAEFSRLRGVFLTSQCDPIWADLASAAQAVIFAYDYRLSPPISLKGATLPSTVAIRWPLPPFGLYGINPPALHDLARAIGPHIKLLTIPVELEKQEHPRMTSALKFLRSRAQRVGATVKVETGTWRSLTADRTDLHALFAPLV
ncbi:hypothetical protein Rhopal_007348-T1 [Rhodotorula paludigena]|uniref:F-box domain-containing protein n=1 Tax=Rhodotorula paludigena TaxID=86838 RepID=A0AAV5GWC6_9BASI|nr:hypothetical protein Rhopal_007348-T1 [Rhodotorula paludigena]